MEGPRGHRGTYREPAIVNLAAGDDSGCSLDPPLPIERSGRWAWRVLGSGCEGVITESASSHLCLEYGTVDGIVFPTRRRAFGRDPQQEEPDRSAPPGVEVTITDIQIRPKGSRT
jgi:hypothetical protein